MEEVKENYLNILKKTIKQHLKNTKIFLVILAQAINVDAALGFLGVINFY